ncbi:SDR family NAD(P)-dependent oxidoreductase [Amycolatopsis sp. cmx-4-68]|uniref:SDR family NAD(P)-dependent oxidoreductase n=1 Tax=Amycolatopsis sp. cmx-4-68 TaxID=2790938 RepID=UPI003978CDF1
MASPENLAAAVAVADTFGDGITAMVNNAAIFRTEDFLTVTEATYTTLMDINVKGTFFGAQAAARSMIDGGRRGSIINVSSLAGLQALARSRLTPPPRRGSDAHHVAGRLPWQTRTDVLPPTPLGSTS